MKRFTIFIFVALSLQGFSQEKPMMDKPNVDKRVELLSIVFRLAGNNEYNSTQFKLYTDKIEQHFSPYKNHELIKFAEKLRKEKSISYDAVMSMAVHLDENLNPRTEFTNSFLEQRWNKDDATMFIKLLQSFFKEAKCEIFFKDNEKLYQEVIAKFLPVYENLDLGWYSSFYGKKPSEKFIIVVALGNGGDSYGPAYQVPNGEKEVYAIMGTWQTDNTGMAIFEVNTYFPALLHEFNHSFVNPLLFQNKKVFMTSGEKIFEVVKDDMRSQAYGNWETMLNEALVRASVIKYFIDHGYDNTITGKMLNEESNKGFLWIKALVAELGKYDTQRDSYPTLESYMPNLADAYKTYAETIVQYDARRPRVESIVEFKNGDVNVDGKIKTVTINFDRQLSGQGYSVFLGAKGKQAFPDLKKISYTNDNKSVVIEVQLLSNKEYQFVLTGDNFKTPEGIPLKRYEVNFKTTK